MSSTSPLAARLAQIFSPRNCILAGSLFFAVGGIVTSQAKDVKVFLLGRAIQGIGGAGIMTISFILVLELAGKKKRGLYIGLVNAGFTTSVSFGALIAGALLPLTGWVGHLPQSMDAADKSERALFWAQSPLSIIFGVGIFFSIPKSFTSGQKGDGEGSIFAKLAKIDYLGAIALVSQVSILQDITDTARQLRSASSYSASPGQN
jgi:MFS family permease